MKTEFKTWLWFLETQALKSHIHDLAQLDPVFLCFINLVYQGGVPFGSGSGRNCKRELLGDNSRVVKEA
ncbi:hypothetical protein Pelo_6468 [Pelomyxa schiedti]|nr:hypothetical protein Pelo_6468 [Pelomyxa schiedti]